jgi:hypothetical protein
VVEAWATDALERMACAAMLEQAFYPVDWMTGFRLTLPHYHGVLAEYDVMTMAYLDSESDAGKRSRKAAFVVRARVPLVRVVGTRPGMAVRVKLEIDPEELEPDTAEERAAAAGAWRAKPTSDTVP